MRIGIAQIATRAGDLHRTCGRIVECAKAAAAEGVELLVFPMAALTGPLPPEETDQEGFLLDLADALEDLAGRVACRCLVPIVWNLDGDPMPEAVLIGEGELVPLKALAYATSLIGGAGSADATQDGQAGGGSLGADPTLPVVTVGDTRLGIAFTYEDLDDFLDYDFGIDAVVYLAGYGYAVDDPSSALGSALAENRYVRDAEDMDAWLVGVGSLGGYGTQVFCGSSFVVTPWGEVAASAPAFEEQLLTCDLDPKAEGPLERPLVPEVYNRPFYLWQALVLGLHDYLTGADGISDAVLELDGSLQSLLLAVLATDALGPTHVHALVSPAAEGERLEWCREVARNLRIDAAELSAADVLPRSGAGRDAGADYVADLVQAHLALLARSVRGTVLGSADKTGLALEAEANRCVAASLMPFGDVYRSDLVELAHMRNTVSPVLPLACEGSYGVPPLAAAGGADVSAEERLRRIDLVLSSHLEWERGLSDIVDHGTSRELAVSVLDRLAACERGRTGRVLYLMVTSRTLFDARRPLGLAWHDRYREPAERSLDEGLATRLQSLYERLVGEAGGDQEQPQTSLSDVMGYLRDFAQGSGERGVGGHQGGTGAGPGVGDGWGNPFSEN